MTFVLEQAKAEIPNVEAELALHEAAENDMAITGPALDEAVQRAAATRRHLKQVDDYSRKYEAGAPPIHLFAYSQEWDDKLRAEAAKAVEEHTEAEAEVRRLEDALCKANEAYAKKPVRASD